MKGAHLNFPRCDGGATSQHKYCLRAPRRNGFHARPCNNKYNACIACMPRIAHHAMGSRAVKSHQWAFRGARHSKIHWPTQASQAFLVREPTMRSGVPIPARWFPECWNLSVATPRHALLRIITEVKDCVWVITSWRHEFLFPKNFIHYVVVYGRLTRGRKHVFKPKG
jgi:hypothetical protein